ncbi:MAG: RICIN domain-containing protein [Bacteroidaceae bacterium]|nr:RICIN domain-containing protein [Bacteroidaceae bacterium]
MKRTFTLLAAALAGITSLSAQITSGSTHSVAADIPHTTIPFRVEDRGTKLPDISWGLDLAWISEGNLQRGVNFAGVDMIDIVRLSFQTTYAVGDDLELSAAQKKVLDQRIGYVKKHAPNALINLNSDQEAGVIDWYHVYGSGSQVSTFAPRWAALIAATKKYVESKGLKVISVSPFNEPDYGEGQTWGWQQGSKAEMREICRLLREDPAYKDDFKDVLLCGGNTLNNDMALAWYNQSRDYLDEGNTHQLAGSFDTFAAFYQAVLADGKVGVGDELHNTMECMVGSQYGLTKGIWWGTCEHTRSQFMKASRGTRLGYAENRTRWTAAGVYRHTDDYREGCAVQGFVGGSERQAAETTFRFAALDHDVFYNGQGPTREYIITTPGFPDKAGYNSDTQALSKNTEGLVNIQGGDDIMPVLPTEAGTYKIVNRGSGHLLAPTSNSLEAGTKMAQVKQLNSTNSNAAVQQWVVTPVSIADGGDYTYYIFTNAKSPTMVPDVRDWSLADGGEVILWQNTAPGDNEKWYFEYAGDGWFYIRSKHSAMCLQARPGTASQIKASGRPVIQGVFTGEAYQQWRLVPADVTVDIVAPTAPTALTATSQPASVRLDWTAPADADLMEYIVLRSTDQEHWQTLHNHVASNAYIDNTAAVGTRYYYKVRAVDQSLNRSEASEAVAGQVTDEPACIMQLPCDSLWDTTVNGNHGALNGNLLQVTGKVGKGLQLNGTTAKFLQLPATIANHRQMTVATWVNQRTGTAWQRIFDFGTDTDHYVFLTYKNGSNNRMRLAIKNGGGEQTLDMSSILTTGSWRHIAVTFSDTEVTLYVDGKAVATSTEMTIRPADFAPVFNYIGRSQFESDPLARVYIDDFRIYNYALSADEIAAIATLADGIGSIHDGQGTMDHVAGEGRIFNLGGQPVSKLRRGVYIVNGKKVLVK